MCVREGLGSHGSQEEVGRLGLSLGQLIRRSWPLWQVRVLMVSDETQMIIHKKPDGGLSAVGGNSVYTYFEVYAPPPMKQKQAII